MVRGFFKNYGAQLTSALSQVLIDNSTNTAITRAFFLFQNLGTHSMYLAFAKAPGQAPVASPPLSAPATPALAASAGGALAAGTVFVKVTYINAFGETVASTEASQVVTLNQQVTVTSPAATSGATGYKVYASTATGTEQVQNGAAAVNIGTNYAITAVATGGSSPPTTNTTVGGVLVTASGTPRDTIVFDNAVPLGSVAIIGTAGDSFFCQTLE